MRCSVFIATSADGYIATPTGGIDWLHTSGNLDADMGSEDMGVLDFMISIDCMIMGRKCMETISGMNLSPKHWPYGDMPLIVLSNTITAPPKNLKDKVEIYSGGVEHLIDKLENRGLKHCYINGGSTITSFINLKLIDDMIITKAPLILGEGIPLFGKIDRNIKLENPKVSLFPNDFIQVKYSVNYL